MERQATRYCHSLQRLAPLTPRHLPLQVDADQSGRLDGRELKTALEAMSEISGDWQHTREAIARYGHGGRTLMLGEFTTLVRAMMARNSARNSAQFGAIA